MLAAGCYSAPDYGGTRFKCDADHGCPEGQTCIAGFCNEGSGSNQVDAASVTGVLCGGTTCAAGQKCCADVLAGPTCMALGATCAGLSATCDGIEDCNGMPCCDGNPSIACGTTCASQICREAADCTDPGAPMCCLGVGPSEPWGRCFATCP